MLNHALTGKLVGTLEAGGVPVVPLKGAALAAAVYGDVGARESSDIDLLVRSEDLDEAVRLIGGLGWAEPEWARGIDGLPRLHRELAHETLPPLELHWRVHWYEESFSAAALARATPDEEGWRRPEPADELAFLLLFLAREGFAGLRQTVDVAAWWAACGAGSDSAAGVRAVAAAHPELAPALSAAARYAEAVAAIPHGSLGRGRCGPVAPPARGAGTGQPVGRRIAGADRRQNCRWSMDCSPQLAVCPRSSRGTCSFPDGCWSDASRNSTTRQWCGSPRRGGSATRSGSSADIPALGGLAPRSAPAPARWPRLTARHAYRSPPCPVPAHPPRRLGRAAAARVLQRLAVPRRDVRCTTASTGVLGQPTGDLRGARATRQRPHEPVLDRSPGRDALPSGAAAVAPYSAAYLREVGRAATWSRTSRCRGTSGSAGAPYTSRPGTARRSSGSGSTTSAGRTTAGASTGSRVTSRSGTSWSRRTPSARRSSAALSASTARSSRPAIRATTC